MNELRIGGPEMAAYTAQREREAREKKIVDLALGMLERMRATGVEPEELLVPIEDAEHEDALKSALSEKAPGLRVLVLLSCSAGELVMRRAPPMVRCTEFDDKRIVERIGAPTEPGELKLPDALEVLEDLLAEFRAIRTPQGPRGSAALQKARDAVKRIRDAKSEAT